VTTTIPNDVAWVVVDAETAGVDDAVDASVDLTLKIDTGGSLDVLNSGSGYVQVIAGSHTYSTTTYDDDATLWVHAGTLDADTLDFRGTSTESLGHAQGDFDVDLEVQNSGDYTTDTSILGYVDWDLASGVQVCAKDVELDNSGTDWTVTGHSNTSELVMYSFTTNSQHFEFNGGDGGLIVSIGSCD
jgi:hypothetical protein